jgi:hypothetical protein
VTRAPGAAPPPSEREPGSQPERPDGVGVFRLAGWGWGLSIALFLLVGLVVVVGYMRDDPGRNPAPATYAAAVCAAVGELAAGTEALAAGIEVRGDAVARREARFAILARVDAANEALAGLPDWSPGRPLNELLASQIITLTNGAEALDSGPADEDLEAARAAQADLEEQLASGRYGFTCG